MTDYKYPYGYSGSPQGMGTMLTWDQMMTKKTVRLLHPELQRRFHALIEYAASCNVPLGCGTGWRVQPSNPPPGFAKPGNSWHESCPTAPESPTALAIDTVPNISWSWMEINVKNYGLKTFRYVNNEPWHIQPYEIPNSRSYATSIPPLQTFPLPGETPTPVPPTTPVGTFTLELQKTELTPENQAQVKGHDDVKLCQFVALGLYRISGTESLDCGNPDGDYGPRTQQAVMTMQAMNKLEQDARCGPKTWYAILNGDGT